MNESSEQAAQTTTQLSPQTMSVLTNFILYNFRFGMLKELRREGPLWGLTKSLLELVAGWFGYVPRWEHCQNQLKRATSKEQLDAIFHELHYLEIDWRSFLGPISVFIDSPTNDPDWRFAHKIKTLRATMQRQIDNYERGVIRPGHSGESFHSYKDYRVSEISPVVWKAFVAALDRLEEMRLAKPGAKPWAEDG